MIQNQIRKKKNNIVLLFELFQRYQIELNN